MKKAIKSTKEDEEKKMNKERLANIHSVPKKSQAHKHLRLAERQLFHSACPVESGIPKSIIKENVPTRVPNSHEST